MKIAPRDVEAFLVAPEAEVRAVLVYGPDAGLVRERAARLAAAVVADLGDPFRVASLTAADVAADPARLHDEAAALALTGGRRVVRLAGAGDAATDLLRRVLESAPGDALIVVEAGPLPPRSSLRMLFEGGARAAAIACYGDEGTALESVIRDTLAAHGLSADGDALAYLTANLGGDRLLTRRELEKLALYMGDGGDARRTVSLEDAAACIGDSAALTTDDLVFAAADGDYGAVDRALGRLLLEGVAPVAILRAAARHLLRLHRAAAALAGGASAEQAMAALRPPVFYKLKGRFRRQLGRWPEERLAAGLDMLLDAERRCKTTGQPEEAICGRALIQLANAARRGRPQRSA